MPRGLSGIGPNKSHGPPSLALIFCDLRTSGLSAGSHSPQQHRHANTSPARYSIATRRPQYRPLVCAEQVSQGRRPPKRQLVQVTGTRCSTGLHPAARKLRVRKLSTTASAHVRTLMVPDGSPPPVHDRVNCRPASSRPSRCQRRTSIDLVASHIYRARGGAHNRVRTFGACASGFPLIKRQASRELCYSTRAGPVRCSHGPK